MPESSSPVDLSGIRPGVTVAWLIVYPSDTGVRYCTMTDATAALNQAAKLHGVRLPLEVPAHALPEKSGG